MYSVKSIYYVIIHVQVNFIKNKSHILLVMNDKYGCVLDLDFNDIL